MTESNPVQTSTYLLGAYNPITFGRATRIDAGSAGSNVGVYGGSSTSWTVSNYGSILGLSLGIDLTSPGSTVTNWGTIGATGATGMGIALPNGGSVTNKSGGSISGYVAIYIGGAGGTVTNAGSISGGATAVVLASGSVDNELGGTLSMTTSGLSTLTAYVGGGGSVTNAGTITNAGYNTAAVVLGDGGRVTNSGTISTTGVLDSAVYTLKGGTVTNSGKLLVSADSSAGVMFINGGALNNTGTINATGSGSVGVWLVNGGTITNSSTIAATAAFGIGVGSESGGTVDNQSGGTISGAVAGILIDSGTGSVANQGEILAKTAGFGVNLAGGGGVANQSGGTISGVDSGVYVDGGSAATNLVTNAGKISGTGTNSMGLILASGGTVKNQNNGTISGVAQGVFMGGGTSSLTNAGHIYGTAASGNGTVVDGAGTVANTGKIIGGNLGVYIAYAGSVTNSGAITGSNRGGVALLGGGSVTDQIGGTITGASFGVYIRSGSAATNLVTNAGRISGTGTNSTGLILASGGTVKNQSGGTISGVAQGVFMAGGTSSLTNAGDVYGTAGSGIGALLSSGGTLTNTGKINGGFLGVYVGGGAGIATNSGAIAGTSQGGVAFAAGGALTNQIGGTISGANFGVDIVGGKGATNAVTNSGAIKGTGTNSAGVTLSSGGSVTNQVGGTINGVADGVSINVRAGAVTNAGTIGGTIASVVFAGAGANTLTLQTGSTLNGGAYGSTASGATSALILQGHGTANNNFTKFNTLTADASGIWTLGGNAVFGNTNASTGTLSVTGSFTSATLEIQSSAQLIDAGKLFVEGSATNSGNLTINGVTMHVASAGGTFTEEAGGTTTLLNGGVLDPPNIVIDGGIFRVGAGSAVDVNGFTQAGGRTTVAGSLVASTINAKNGLLDFTGPVTSGDGVGALNVGAFGDLEFDRSVDNTHAVTLASPTGGTLSLGDAGAFNASINGFAGSDAIDLLNQPIAALSYSGSSSSGVLTVSESSGTLATLHFNGNYSNSSFAFASDGHGGTDILRT
jgi:hypothetical protein